MLIFDNFETVKNYDFDQFQNVKTSIKIIRIVNEKDCVGLGHFNYMETQIKVSDFKLL